MPLPYGFMLAPDGHIAIDQEKANIVRTTNPTGKSLTKPYGSVTVHQTKPSISEKWEQGVWESGQCSFFGDGYSSMTVWML